jgi:hypothetical protein
MKELNEPKEELLTDTEKSIVDMYANFFEKIYEPVKPEEEEKDELYI